MKAFSWKPDWLDIDLQWLWIKWFNTVTTYPELELIKVFPDGNSTWLDILISYQGKLIVHPDEQLRIKDFSESGYALFEDQNMNVNQYWLIDSEWNRRSLKWCLPKEIDPWLKFISNKSLCVLFNESFRFYDIEQFLITWKLETQSIVNMKELLAINDRQYAFIDSLGVTTENGCQWDGTFYVRVDKSTNRKDPKNDEFRRSDIFEIAINNWVPTVKKLLENVFYKNWSISPFIVNDGILSYLKENPEIADKIYFYDIKKWITIGYLDRKNQIWKWNNWLLQISNPQLNLWYVINKNFEVVFACNNSSKPLDDYFPILKWTKFWKISGDFTESFYIEWWKIYQFKKDNFSIYWSNWECYWLIQHNLKFGWNGFPDLPETKESNWLLHVYWEWIKWINSYILNEQGINWEEHTLHYWLFSSQLALKALPPFFKNSIINDKYYLINKEWVTLLLNWSNVTLWVADVNKNLININHIGKSNIFSIWEEKRIWNISRENIKYPIFENIIKNLKKVTSETEDSLVIDWKKFKKKFLKLN